MRKIAIILAGGTGSRLGGKRPKQLIEIDGSRTILETAVEAFENAGCIDEICIVMHPDYVSEAKVLCRKNGWQKVRHIIPGGKERWESSWHAIQAYQTERDCALLLHDAARPYVSQRIIRDVCAALEVHEAVTVAIPVTDTLYHVAGDAIDSIPPRCEYMRAQTPQAFRLPVIEEAYRRAVASCAIEATDDCGIMHRYMPETAIHIVSGDEENRKITYSSDLNTTS